jgi:hypothetical protein
MARQPPAGGPQPPPSPPPPRSTPASGPPPGGPARGPRLLWLWLALGGIAVAAIGVGAYLLLSGGDAVERGWDGPAGSNEARISVQTGPCSPADGTTPIDVAIDPPDAASVTLAGEDGLEESFSGSGGSAAVAPGAYTWTAAPAEGFTVSGQSRGSLTIEPCQQIEGGFTVQEEALAARIPGRIRASCQQIPPEQALATASASLLCEHQGTTLFYDLFPNTSQMETYYASRVREFGVPPGSGFCDTAERAENAYVRSRGQREFEVGRLLCFRDAGNAVFIWTDQRVEIAVEAQRSDPTNRQLFRLWSRVEFGPIV